MHKIERTQQWHISISLAQSLSMKTPTTQLVLLRLRCLQHTGSTLLDHRLVFEK